MKLTHEEEMQAYTDALGAIVTALAWQVDAIRLYADLQVLADVAAKAGHGPSAGLIDELARTVQHRVLVRKDH
jgi:hypothetical protein